MITTDGSVSYVRPDTPGRQDRDAVVLLKLIDYQIPVLVAVCPATPLLRAGHGSRRGVIRGRNSRAFEVLHTP